MENLFVLFVCEYYFVRRNGVCVCVSVSAQWIFVNTRRQLTSCGIGMIDDLLNVNICMCVFKWNTSKNALEKSVHEKQETIIPVDKYMYTCTRMYTYVCKRSQSKWCDDPVGFKPHQKLKSSQKNANILRNLTSVFFHFAAIFIRLISVSVRGKCFCCFCCLFM